MDITDGAVAALTDAELPVYTVLVPMYREAKVLPLLVDALKKLDYPASKLEVKLVLEEDDSETIDAAKALRPPGIFEIVRVPPVPSEDQAEGLQLRAASSRAASS